MINNVIQFLIDHPYVWEIIKHLASEPEFIFDIIASIPFYIWLVYDCFFASSFNYCQPASPDFTQEVVCKMNSASGPSGSSGPTGPSEALYSNPSESPNFSESNSSQETLRESSKDLWKQENLLLRVKKIQSLALNEKEEQVEELELYIKTLNECELTDTEKRSLQEKYDVTKRQVEDTNYEISKIENIKLGLEREVRVKSALDYLNQEGSFKEERQENAHILGKRVEKAEEQYKKELPALKKKIEDLHEKFSTYDDDYKT